MTNKALGHRSPTETNCGIVIFLKRVRGFMFVCPKSPLRLILGLRVRTRRRTERGEESSAWVQIHLADVEFEKVSSVRQDNSRQDRVAGILVSETPSTFHPRAQRNAFRFSMSLCSRRNRAANCEGGVRIHGDLPWRVKQSVSTALK